MHTSEPQADRDTWIRRFRHVPDADLRLVCFPHAGGSASFYFPVATALAEKGIEVLALQYPGRQDRRAERPITDLGRLADAAADALSSWPMDRSAFFGHSMGAALAFETARRMDRPPLGLVASGRRAPSRRRIDTVHGRDDAGIVAEIRRLGGTETALLEDEEMREAFLPAIRADYTAIETYSSDPGSTVPCPVTVFTGDSDPQVTLDEARAWRNHTTGTFDLVVFQGGHFYLTTSPATVIDRLGRLLVHWDATAS
ncbi:thioesterase II family protein [Spirillospora sp. NPDC048911]|uniref:thioesterase II family protein n=1 Tax=Spirillospora sp. NPDC048911 TaxID=3364527 RepID=UPI00371730A8